MADDFTLKISIPKADDKAFNASLNKILAKLAQVDKQIKKVDASAAKLGSKTGRGATGSASRGSTSRAVAPVIIPPSIPKTVSATGKKAVETNKKLKDLSRTAGALGSIFGGSAGRLGAFSSGLSGIVSAAGKLNKTLLITAAVVVGLTIVVVKSIKAFSEFEASLGGVSRVANLSASEAERFGESALGIASEMPVTTQEVFKFADALANAGLRGKDLDQATRSFSKLGSVIKGLDTAKVQDILRLRQLSGTEESIDILNSKLLKLSQTVVATATQITKASAQIAQAFAGTGAGLDEILAIGATVAGLTKNSQRLSTSLGKVRQALSAINGVPDDKLKSILDTLQTGAQLTTDEFRELVAAEGGVTRAFDLILNKSTDLRNALDGLGLSAKSTGNTLVRSFAKQAELLEKARLAVRGTTDSGILNQQAAQRAEEFSAKVTLLGNAFGELGVRLGSIAAIVVGPILTGFTGIINVLSTVASAVQGVIGTFGDLLSVGGDVLSFLSRVSGLTSFAEGVFGNPKKEAAEVEKETKASLARLNKAFRAESKKLGDIRLVDQKPFNADFIKIIGVARQRLIETGIEASKVQDLLSDLEGLNPVKLAVPALERMAKLSDEIAQNLKRVADFGIEIGKELANVQFEISLVGLDDIDQAIERITKKAEESTVKLNFDFESGEKQVFDAASKVIGLSPQVLQEDIGHSLDAAEVLLSSIEAMRRTDGANSALVDEAINLVNIYKTAENALDGINTKRQELIKLTTDKATAQANKNAFDTLKSISEINMSPLQKAFSDLGEVINTIFQSDKLGFAKTLEAQEKVALAFAVAGKSVNDDITQLQNKLDNIDLKGLDKGLAEITQKTAKALSEATLPDIAREQADSAILEKEAQLKNDILRRDRLQRLNLIKLDEQAQERKLLKERDQIANTQAAGVASITDAGSAVESVNQTQRTNELQEELLIVNEQQLAELKKQTAKLEKKLVAVPPAR